MVCWFISVLVKCPLLLQYWFGSLFSNILALLVPIFLDVTALSLLLYSFTVCEVFHPRPVQFFSSDLQQNNRKRNRIEDVRNT